MICDMAGRREEEYSGLMNEEPAPECDDSRAYAVAEVESPARVSPNSDKSADEASESGEESTQESASLHEPQAPSGNASPSFADGDRIIWTRPDGRISCGRIVGMISTGESEPSGLVEWREPCDESNPTAFSGSQDILNPVNFLTCVRADLHLIFRNQRYSLFGFPDTKYIGHPFFTRIVHTEFGAFTFGTKIQSASGGLLWCLGIIDTQTYRSPLRLVLYNIAKSSITELPMTKQCSKLTVKPKSSDKDSYLEAINTFTMQANRESSEVTPDNSMDI